MNLELLSIEVLALSIINYIQESLEFCEYKTLSSYTHTHIKACKKHARKHTYAPISVCIQTYTHIRTQTHANIHTRTQTHTHSHTHTYTYIQIESHTYTHISARACTHQHKHTQCSFVVGDPSFRNHLPDDVKEAGFIYLLKQILKTFVFSQSFEISAFFNL